MASSFDWWVKETTRGTSMVVKMENPNNWSMVELEAPSEDEFLPHSDNGSTLDHHQDKARNKNAKQLTWVFLLKAHRVVGCLTSIVSAMFSLTFAISCCVASRKTDIDKDVGKNSLSYFSVVLPLACHCQQALVETIHL